jgi:hypothetical protein
MMVGCSPIAFGARDRPFFEAIVCSAPRQRLMRNPLARRPSQLSHRVPPKSPTRFHALAARALCLHSCDKIESGCFADQCDREGVVPMDNEEQQHLEGLRRIYQKRLWKLEQQAALQGASTPPEVQIELDELQKKMVDMTTRLGMGNVPTSVALPPTTPHDSTRLGPLSIDQVHEEKIDAVITELRQVHDLYRLMLPPSELFPRLYKLFRRNTFQERVRDCLTADWVSRVRSAMLTVRVLRAYSPSISRFGTHDQDTWFTDLIGAVQGYTQNLPGLFVQTFPLTLVDKYLYDTTAWAQQLPQPFPKSRLDPQAISRCDERLEAISSLWQQIGYRALLDNDASDIPAG